MSQTVFTAKEAKNNFGRLLGEAQRIPVAIKKNGRKVAYVISEADYSHYEDFERVLGAYWGKKAQDAAKGGYLTVAQSEKLLRSALNVKH